jgi:hypothetical protein
MQQHRLRSDAGKDTRTIAPPQRQPAANEEIQAGACTNVAAGEQHQQACNLQRHAY